MTHIDIPERFLIGSTFTKNNKFILLATDGEWYHFQPMNARNIYLIYEDDTGIQKPKELEEIQTLDEPEFLDDSDSGSKSITVPVSALIIVTILGIIAIITYCLFRKKDT
jgi:hypothetical protein